MSANEGQVGETAQQRELLKMAQFRSQRAMQVELPAIRQMGQQIVAAHQPGSFEREHAAGAAQTEAAAAFTQAGEQARANAARTGTLGTGKAALDIVQRGADQATATGMGTVAAGQGQEDKYVAGLQALTAAGQGQQATANQGATTAAQLSGQNEAAAAQRSLSESIGNAGLAAQLVGTGLALSQGSGGETPVYDYDYRGTTLPNQLRGGGG